MNNNETALNKKLFKAVYFFAFWQQLVIVQTEYLKFLSLAHQMLASCEMPVILCIGSDKVTGDALGPVVGHILTKEMNVPSFVYGTLSRPVNALNLLETIAFIKHKHRDKKLLVIDSSVGSSEDIGKISIKYGGIYPGAASGKNLPKIGDFSITATVCSSASLLGCVSLGFIFKISKQIASAISSSLSMHHSECTMHNVG
ncbi:MAG: spore protease YyaC [Firmicutes bacterium]|nr:spore protease YyaC [Bacillota bacterium]